MRRHDPFESMERMMEQLRMATFGGAGFGPDFGRGGRGEGHPALGTGEDADLATADEARPWMAPWTGTSGRGMRLERTDDGFVAMADLPGFEKEDITVRLDDRRLAVEAVHEAGEGADSASWRGTRHVREVVDLPLDAEPLADEVTASYRNGVLEVEIPTTDADGDDEHVIDVE